MQAFLPSEDHTLSTNRFVRHYVGGSIDKEVPVDRLIIDIGGEADILKKALLQAHKERHAKDEVLQIGSGEAGTAASGADAASGAAADGSGAADGATADQDAPKVHVVQEHMLLPWSAFPPRLGRVSSRYVNDGLFRHPDEGDVLSGQLTALKARHPAKKHFRLAVVNAFGTNLGDCMLGMTAMRHIAGYLRRHLDSVTIDLLLGANSGATNFDIAGHEDWVGEQHLLGPTLNDFARYDAYFDFTGLIGLPRITELAIGDWYLWWSGLDPATVPVQEKRNIMYHSWPVWQEVSQHLQGIKGRKVFFNPKASVPLRTFPDEQAAKFVKSLLKAAPELHIVVDRELKVSHPRLIDLSKEINSATKFAALVAQMDGMISVDSFALHAADAASVPSVGLFASIDPYAYPYYPHHKGLLIPGGETLPAYKRFKIDDEQEWAKMKDAYTGAWAQLKAADVLSVLQDRMNARNGVPTHNGIRFANTPHAVRRHVETPQGRTPPHENVPEIWQKGYNRVMEIARTLVRPRTNTILVTPGSAPLAVQLANNAGLEGQLHIFEPRRLRRELLSLDLMERASQARVHWHDTIPSNAELFGMPLDDELSETSPAAWGNLRQKRQMVGGSIDKLGLTPLNAIIMVAPMAFKMGLETAFQSLETYQPAILCGPIMQLDEVRQMAAMLHPRKYQCWIEQMQAGNAQACIMLAVAAHVKVQGLKKVQLD
ncbi:glycosyltransferase family 9 protein [Niveispirillum fermenti]|uniref:glycosyltransferase family 9 protein n=1 Tax=Niveispirillum fermenti TaxID=1233113 RepID=UPI003A87A72E